MLGVREFEEVQSMIFGFGFCVNFFLFLLLMDRFFGLLTLFGFNSLKNQFRHHLISLFFILRTHFSFKRIEAFVAEIMHHFGLKSFHIVVMIFLLLLLNCIFQKLVVI